MEINEVATLKVRELPAAADRKGSSGERGERGQSQVKFITPLSRSQYLIKRKGSGVCKREREREKRAKTAKLITFSGCSLTIKSSLKIRHPVKSFQMRSMVLFAEEGRRRRICLFCKLIKEGSSLPGLDGPTTRKIRDCIREAGGEKGLAGLTITRL